MLTHEHRQYAESARAMILQGYAYKGDAWAHALAARVVWEVGQVVSDIHGRSKAVAMLDAVSDSINAMAATSPTPELETRVDPPPPGCLQIALPRCDADVENLLAIVGAMRGSWDKRP